MGNLTNIAIESTKKATVTLVPLKPKQRDAYVRALGCAIYALVHQVTERNELQDIFYMHLFLESIEHQQTLF